MKAANLPRKIAGSSSLDPAFTPDSFSSSPSIAVPTSSSSGIPSRFFYPQTRRAGE